MTTIDPTATAAAAAMRTPIPARAVHLNDEVVADIRIECLRLAVHAEAESETSGGTIVMIAQTFADFVLGGRATPSLYPGEVIRPSCKTAGIDVTADGITIEVVDHPGGLVERVWRRDGRVMGLREVNEYLGLPPRRRRPVSGLRRALAVLRGLANHGETARGS